MVSIVQQQKQQQQELKQLGKQWKDTSRGCKGGNGDGGQRSNPEKDQWELGLLTTTVSGVQGRGSSSASKAGTGDTGSSNRVAAELSSEVAAGVVVKSWPSFEGSGKGVVRTTGGGGSGGGASYGTSSSAGGGVGKFLDWAAATRTGLAEDGVALAATLAAGVTLRQQGAQDEGYSKVLGAEGQGAELKEQQQEREQWEEEVDTEVLCLVCDPEKKIIVTGGNDASIRVSQAFVK
jgi:hypothetical protein